MKIEEELEAFKKRYSNRLNKELTGKDSDSGFQGETTRDYETFKKQYISKRLSLYEKACNFSEKLLKVAPDKKKVPELLESIEICHLKITPTGVMSFAMIMPLAIILFFLLFGFMIPYALTGVQNMFFVIFGLVAGVAVMPALQKMPQFLANGWRLKASNQMVLCVFYIVTYMRHTSNLELAIDFAAEHLSPPLSIDLKKVIWNIETEKYSSIKESLDIYLLTWRKWNLEFIESMHLIQSSLYETSESRRKDSLDKGLRVMLDETYEKMLHYAHDLKGPLTTLHMLGIIMPILGLVILPLVVSFMPEVKWYHLFMIYNVTLPLSVYYLASKILATRPTGYGDSDIAELNPALKKFRNIIIRFGRSEFSIKPIFISSFVFILLFLLALSPLFLWSLGGDSADWSLGLEGFKTRSVVENPSSIKFSLLDYRTTVDKVSGESIVTGPYGLGAAIISLAMPLAFGLGLGLWYKFRSKNVIKIRNKAKELENEFAGALFQLGNRLGDGYPAEIAFQKVSVVMDGTVSGKFFELVSVNIQKLGMGVEKAIFDSKRGALVYYPSNLIESSMKVLVESSKKGPMIASQALINVSEYIKQMHRVDERLRDLMADIISSMKSQISFLTPAIAGIVIGITSMIAQILGTLSGRLASLSAEGSSAGVGGAGFVMDMFGNGVPTFYFQIIVGLYVVQIVFILTKLINGIQNGSDKLNERYLLGVNMIKSTITYVSIAFVVMLIFSIVAGSIVNTI